MIGIKIFIFGWQIFTKWMKQLLSKPMHIFVLHTHNIKIIFFKLQCVTIFMRPISDEFKTYERQGQPVYKCLTVLN